MFRDKHAISNVRWYSDVLHNRAGPVKIRKIIVVEALSEISHIFLYSRTIACFKSPIFPAKSRAAG